MTESNGPAAFDQTLVVVTSRGMGRGDDELRIKLLKTYLRLLADSRTYPGAIALYTEGVTLACEGSPVLDELAVLADAGVHIVLCMTCLNHYGLKDSVRVGIIGGMTDLIAAQQTAAKVITL